MAEFTGNAAFRLFILGFWVFAMIVWVVAVFNPGKGGLGLQIFSICFLVISASQLIRLLYGWRILVYSDGLIRRGLFYGSRWIDRSTIRSVSYKQEATRYTGTSRISLVLNLDDGANVGLLWASPQSSFDKGTSYVEDMHDWLQEWLEKPTSSVQASDDPHPS
jgi:hypothetical protein